MSATEKQALELYQPMQADVAIHRPPTKVLSEAHEAAKALQSVITGKKKPVIFNNEQYLEFEDWQTVGRFYGITAKVRETHFVQYDKVNGFEASADALLVNSGQIISSADAMCLNDEPNWSKKPMFQLRSMAQTRACAKALRNVLAWVVVLAGYKPTPAEEMDDVFDHKTKQQPVSAPPKQENAPEDATASTSQSKSEVITDAQRRRLYAIGRSAGMNDEQFKAEIEKMGYKSSKDVTKESYEDICTSFAQWKP